MAGGPIAGFVLSRGPGLPDYTDDRGNCTEPLALLTLTITVLLRARRRGTTAAG